MDAFEQLELETFEQDNFGFPQQEIDQLRREFELTIHNREGCFTADELAAFAEQTDFGDSEVFDPAVDESVPDDEIPQDEIAAVRLMLAELGYAERDIEDALIPELEPGEATLPFGVPGTRDRRAA